MCLFVMCLFICSLTVLNYSTNEDKTCATLVSVNPTGNMFVCITVKKNCCRKSFNLSCVMLVQNLIKSLLYLFDVDELNSLLPEKDIFLATFFIDNN